MDTPQIAIPFISHVEKQISPEQAAQIAEILGLPPELSFLNLSIDERLTLRAFARGLSKDQPFNQVSVPFNWLPFEEPVAPTVLTINQPPVSPEFAAALRDNPEFAKQFAEAARP